MLGLKLNHASKRVPGDSFMLQGTWLLSSLFGSGNGLEPIRLQNNTWTVLTHFESDTWVINSNKICIKTQDVVYKWRSLLFMP